MKLTALCLVVLAAVVCLEAVPAKIDERVSTNIDDENVDESDTSACPYVYYLWGKKYTIFCDPFCANYNKIATCVNGTCQCLKKPKTS